MRAEVLRLKESYVNCSLGWCSGSDSETRILAWPTDWLVGKPSLIPELKVCPSSTKLDVD